MAAGLPPEWVLALLRSHQPLLSQFEQTWAQNLAECFVAFAPVGNGRELAAYFTACVEFIVSVFRQMWVAPSPPHTTLTPPPVQ